MNITMSEIYWLTRLDEFSVLFSVVFFTLVIIDVANVFGGFIAMDDARDDRIYNRMDKVRDDEARMRNRFCRATKIGVALYNHTFDCFIVHRGDRIAQLVLAPVVRAAIEETDDLGGATERGTGGFGSTGR